MDTFGGRVTLTYGLLGLLLVALGIPLALGRVGPNRWYGFRVARTFEDPQIWFAANRVAGIDLCIAGVVVVAAALIIGGLAQRRPTFPIVTANVLVVLTSLALVALHSWLALRRL
jgi:uncharacterized membrane protein